MSTPAKKLSPAEVAEVMRVLAEARAGHATLAQLARAHDLASGADLNGTLGELREHIRAMVPRPAGRDEAKAVLLGCVTCALSKKLGRHYLGMELNANYAQLFNKRISEVNSGVSTG